MAKAKGSKHPVMKKIAATRTGKGRSTAGLKAFQFKKGGGRVGKK